MNVGVDISPHETVTSIPGQRVFFNCVKHSKDAQLNVFWKINGTLLNKSKLMIVFEGYDRINGMAHLVFILPLRYNFTTIQCVYMYHKGNVSSEIVTVLLQGQL